MPIMFAEDIGGWLVAGGVLFGSWATSMLALIALVPATRGRRRLTLCLITPALIMAVVAVCYFANMYAHRESHDREEIFVNYIQPWFFMGLPPLATSALTTAFLLWNSRKK